MTLTYGFYNSSAGDRKYDAVQMSSIFDGIIHDGIYSSIGDSFAVAHQSGRNITVGTGRAWFDHTWSFNDAAIPLSIAAAEAVLNRYDAVVLEIGVNLRANSVKVIRGTPASSPVRPAMVKDANTKQYPLAYIYVKANTANLSPADITNMVGSSETPFVTGVLSSFNTDALLGQWSADWDVWKNDKASSFTSWFNSLSVTLESNVAANLEANILAVDAKVTALKTQAGYFETLEQALPVQNKRNFYRGQSLGTSFSPAQKAAVANGSFTGMWIGDYWTINGVVWRIVDIDYWLGLGSTPFNDHHLVIMPDTSLYLSKMNNSNSTSGGYAGSYMYTTGLTSAKATVETAFPGSVKTRNISYNNECNYGVPTKYAYYNATVELATEVMIFGEKFFSSQGPYEPPTSASPDGNRQLAIFKLNNVYGATNFWLRDTSTRYTFCAVDNLKAPDIKDASGSYGVRPVFAIG